MTNTDVNMLLTNLFLRMIFDTSQNEIIMRIIACITVNNITKTNNIDSISLINVFYAMK